MAATEPRPHSAPGQWVHAGLFGTSLEPGSQISLGEGDSPLQPATELGRRLGIADLWLKREDLQPTGSHKGRCLSLLCSELRAEGGRRAVISSSGNAAVAAAAYADAAAIRLLALVSPRTPEVKLRALLAAGQLTVLSDRPVGLLHHARDRYGMVDLRASTHPRAPAAYRGISAELAQAGGCGALFVFSSSGAAALGIWQGFQLLGAARPQLHVVQAEPGGELTRPWYPGAVTAQEPAQVGDLGAQRSRLAPALRRSVRESGGRGWRVRQDDMEEIRQLAGAHDVSTSWEGLAVLAAMRRAAGSAASAPGRWVAVLTGAAAQLDLRPAADPERLAPWAGTAEDLDRILQGQGLEPRRR